MITIEKVITDENSKQNSLLKENSESHVRVHQVDVFCEPRLQQEERKCATIVEALINGDEFFEHTKKHSTTAYLVPVS